MSGTILETYVPAEIIKVYCHDELTPFNRLKLGAWKILKYMDCAG
jgi:hypothetical protein